MSELPWILVLGTLSRENNMHGSHFHDRDPQFASWILGAMTQSCYIGTRDIRSRVIRGPYSTCKMTVTSVWYSLDCTGKGHCIPRPHRWAIECLLPEGKYFREKYDVPRGLTIVYHMALYIAVSSPAQASAAPPTRDPHRNSTDIASRGAHSDRKQRGMRSNSGSGEPVVLLEPLNTKVKTRALLCKLPWVGCDGLSLRSG